MPNMLQRPIPILCYLITLDTNQFHYSIDFATANM